MAHVIARGEFGDNAAILIMQRDLRVQSMREQAALGVIQRDAGFVTGRFNAQYQFHDAFSLQFFGRTIVRFIHMTVRAAH